MYRLVIADDEKAIRETIATFIDWKSLDIEVVAVCKNGNEAYDAILDEYPDIVLTDIRMPGMSGLEMIQRLKDVGGNIEFIILSGYGEFEYAKKAMELGVDHYLLKPCNENEIIKVIEEAKRTCQKKRHFLDLSSQQYAAKTDVFSSRIWTIMEDALSTENLDASLSTFSEFLEMYQTDFLLCRYTIDKSKMSGVVNSLTNACREQFPDKVICFFQTQHNLYLLCDVNDQEILTLDPCVIAENITVRSDLEEMLRYVLQRIQFHGQVSVLVHNVPLPLKGISATPIAEEVIGTMKDAVSSATSSNKAIDKTIQYIKEHISDQNLSLKNIAETHLYMNVDYVSKQFVKYTGKRFSAYLNELKIEKAKQMLAEDKDLKISAVAEAVGCANNPQYFNYIFKKQTGMTPSNFQQTCATDREN